MKKAVSLKPFVMRGWKLPAKWLLIVGAGEAPHTQIRRYTFPTLLEARAEGFRMLNDETAGWEWATVKEVEILNPRKRRVA